MRKGLLIVFLLVAGMVGGGCRQADSWETPHRVAIEEQIKRCLGSEVASIRVEDGVAEVRNEAGDVLGYALFPVAASESAVGFRGPVPIVVICDGAGRILQVALLPNAEDEKFLQKIVHSGMLEEWCGFPVTEADSLAVDAVTGATYSSQAILVSLQNLLQKHKNHAYGEGTYE